MGQTGGHKIANFVFLPDISFILAFTVLECIKRYWEALCDESRKLVRFTPTSPLMCQTAWGHKIVDFVFWPFISFILAFRVLECIKRYWETLYEESR